MLSTTNSRSHASGHASHSRRGVHDARNPPPTAVQCREAWSLARGCPPADSGGEGAGGGAFHPSVVVALVGIPQLLSCSVSVLACSALVKVLPSLALTVAVVDIFLVWRGWFLRVFLVELLDDVGQVLEVVGRIPGTIRVVETGPLDSILDLVSVVSRVEDFLHFPLLLFLDDNGRWWRLMMSGDRFCTGCGFESEADMENWMDFDSGRQVQLIGT